jgi:hypothetical protein
MWCDQSIDFVTYFTFRIRKKEEAVDQFCSRQKKIFIIVSHLTTLLKMLL